MKIYYYLLPNLTWTKREEALLECISPERKEKVLAYKAAPARLTCLYGALLVKHALFDCFGISLNASSISYEPKGKPYLSKYPDIHFNLSHSGHMVLCAVDHFPVGADIEKVKMNPPLEIMRLVYLKEEQESILTSARPSVTFFEYWTRKEAYGKCLGEGITSEAILQTDIRFDLEEGHFSSGLLFDELHQESYAYSIFGTTDLSDIISIPTL